MAVEGDDSTGEHGDADGGLSQLREPVGYSEVMGFSGHGSGCRHRQSA